MHKLQKFSITSGQIFRPATIQSSVFRVKSSATTTTSNVSSNIEIPGDLDLTFCDGKGAYRSKSNSELLRALVVLKACSYNSLVDNQDKLLKWSRKILGGPLFRWVMKKTFYGHFVAGETHEKIRPLIEKNFKFGVKSILDYSAEKDISEAEAEQREESSCTTPQVGTVLVDEDVEQKGRYRYQREFADRRMGVTGARTYFYEDEHQCDRNLDIFMSCIDAVSGAALGTGFAAVKLTALGRPEFLMQLSEQLVKSSGDIDSASLLQVVQDEHDQMKNMIDRVNALAAHAQAKDVRVMIDAEQTYLQPAISRITIELMRRFNTEKAVIFNTYQCYLKEALSKITTDLELSRKEKFYFGAKIVRGAYMEQERERALSVGYDDPINPNYDATTQMYHGVLDHVLQSITARPIGEIAVMVASHNEESVKYAVEQMAANGISPQDRVICFGQLLGMCDQVSFSLGQAGYSVYKYVPYGPVEEVLPYLSRRAQENRGIIQKAQKERQLIFRELVRRIWPGSSSTSST